ncbi:hypothetical protein C8F01DRAFT_1367118 [Mycena amicta]|nr:hypothetical protein C8F01DRAFT_1367118 [Mycena amicta]
MARSLESYGPAEIAHGPLFIGLFLNVMLYGIMIIQTYLYFLTYRRDKAWTKIFVVSILCLDTFNTALDFGYLYKCLIVHYGDVAMLARADWCKISNNLAVGHLTRSSVCDGPRDDRYNRCMRATVLCVANQGTIPKTFHGPRYNLCLLGVDGESLVGRLRGAFFTRRVRYVLSLSINLELSGRTAGAIGTSVEVHLNPEFVEFIRFKSVVIVWLGASATADILITSILVVYLVRSKSHKTGLAGTDVLVDRIIRMTVQTGLATSLCATIDLILFLADPVALHLIFNIPLCKLYTNSLLSSLNSRSTQDSSSAGTGVMASKQPLSRNHRPSVFIELGDPTPAPVMAEVARAG